MIKQWFAISLLLMSLLGKAVAEPITEGDSVLVLGATGGTGQLVVKQLLDKGVKVVAGVRDIEKGKAILGSDIKLVKLDVTQQQTLFEATNSIAAVVNAVGADVKAGGEEWIKQVEFNGNANLVAAAKHNGLKKIVLVSSMGATQKDHFFNRIANNILIWKFEGEQAIRNSGIDYTIVRPGGLKDGPSGQRQIKFMQGDKKGNTGFIDRSDVARVCIAALFSADASGKTFELVSEDGVANNDFEKAFKALSHDK